MAERGDWGRLSEECRGCLPSPKVSSQEGAEPFLVLEPPEGPPDPARSACELQDSTSSSPKPELSGACTPGSITWMAPLAWLEQMLPGSPVLAALRQSLPPGMRSDNITPTSTACAAIRASPLGLLEASGSASLGEGAALLQQDTCSSTPLSVPSMLVWSPPANLLETQLNASTEKPPVLPWTTGTTFTVGSEGPAETSASPPSPLEACMNATLAEKPPVLHQDWLTCLSPTSPLSFLEPGLYTLPEGTVPASRCNMVNGILPASTASVEIQTSPSGVLEARASRASVPQEEKGTCLTPVCVAPAATWTSPPGLLEAAVNTSLGLNPSTTESAAETDSLLWHCSRDQLNSLSRAELQRRLESALIIVEVLAHQIRACQDVQRPIAHVGPADQRDADTQTPISEPKEEEYRDLYVDLSRRHQALQRSRESEKHLAQQLASAVGELGRWSSASQLLQGTADASFQNLQEDRTALAQQQKQMGALLSLCRDTLRKWGQKQKEMKEELEEIQEANEAVCRKLEERTVEVVAALSRANELMEANACLGRDLDATQQKLAAVEGEREQLQQENVTLSQQLMEKKEVIQTLEEETARLSREKDQAEQERGSAQRDFREVSECREFLEQENQIAHRQLSEMEQELKAALSTLLQRSSQLEDLKDADAKLRQEQEALSEELASCRAEIQRARACTEAFLQVVREARSVQAHFLQTADFLRAALRGEEPEDPQRSCGYYTPVGHTPHRSEASFVDSVLQAAAEKDAETPGLWSDTTAFTKAAPALPPTLSEVQGSLAVCTQELREAAGQLRLLSAQCQTAKREEVKSLQAKNLQLQRQMEGLEMQLRDEIEAGHASISRLHKALHVRIQTEKELRQALSQQDENLQHFFDQSGEIRSLQKEVDHLKHFLQKSETEAAALWEELRGTRPADLTWVQEKILLQKDVRKLRELLLQKDDDRSELLSNHLRQVQRLEGQLHQAQQVLKKHRRVEAEMRQVLSTLPMEVAGIPEVHRLSELLA